MKELDTIIVKCTGPLEFSLVLNRPDEGGLVASDALDPVAALEILSTELHRASDPFYYRSVPKHNYMREEIIEVRNSIEDSWVVRRFAGFVFKSDNTYMIGDTEGGEWEEAQRPGDIRVV